MNNQFNFFKSEDMIRDQNKNSDWGIIGHKTQVNYLKSNIKENNIAHAYLFAGEEALGKKKVSLSFIKSLFCPSSTHFCNKCSSCNQINKNLHPDLFLISGEEKIKINTIREIIKKINLKPFNAPYKTAIIDNAENLTDESSNALLKTLEEPPGHTIIILIVNNALNLLPTVVSRLRIIKFFRVPKKINEEEFNSIELNKKEKLLYLELSMGKPGITKEFLENKEKKEILSEWFNTFKEINQSSKAESLIISTQIAKKYSSNPEPIIEMLKFWVIILRDILNFKNRNNYKTFVTEYFNMEINEKIGNNSLINLINQINVSIDALSGNSGFNAKIIFDLIALEVSISKVLK